MKNILFIHLGKRIEAYHACATIEQIKKENPHAQVDVLCFKRQEGIFKALLSPTTIHTIDQVRLKRLYTSPILSNSQLINEYTDSIKACISTHWNIVYNFSSNQISSYITSSLDAQEYRGTLISQHGAPKTHNPELAYRCFHQARNKEHVISSQDIALSSIGMSEQIRLELSSSLADINKADQHFKQMRSLKENATIIGIDLSKDLNSEHLRSYIQELNESQSYLPIVMHQGSPSHIHQINELNRLCHNQLPSVHISLSNMPIIMKNLDLCITSNQEIMMLNSLIGKRTILMDTTRNLSHFFDELYLILVNEASELSDDLLYLTSQIFDETLGISQIQTKNKMFQTIKDSFGYFLTQIKGDIHLNFELFKIFKRQADFQNLYGQTDEKLLQNLSSQVDSSKLRAFLNYFQDQLQEEVIDILKAHRSFSQFSQSPQAFIQDLTKLVSKNQNEELINQSAYSLLEAQVENMPSSLIEENLDFIQAELKIIKNNVTKLQEICKNLLNQNSRQEFSKASL